MTRYSKTRLELCVLLAREASRDSWQHGTHKQRRDSRRISREFIQDARYWRSK